MTARNRTPGLWKPIDLVISNEHNAKVIEVRREADNELCGHIDELDQRWRSLTVFGGHLATFDDPISAREHVLTVGLASLAERWWYRVRGESEWQVVCIQEASPDSVQLALDYYAMPGVPTVTLTRHELDTSIELSLSPD